jgi:gluconokinase
MFSLFPVFHLFPSPSVDVSRPFCLPPNLPFPQDRIPWLHLVREAGIRASKDTTRGRGKRAGCVVACSALKRTYRDLLRGEEADIPLRTGEEAVAEPFKPKEIETFFLYRLFSPISRSHFFANFVTDAEGFPADLPSLTVHGTRPLLLARMQARPRHFMKSSMLDSQLAVLEQPILDNEPNVATVTLGEGEEEAKERGLEAVMKDALRTAQTWAS